MAKSRIWGAETPEPIATKFCLPGAVHNIIMNTNFGGFGVERGQILPFPLTCLIAFKTLSHYCPSV